MSTSMVRKLGWDWVTLWKEKYGVFCVFLGVLNGKTKQNRKSNNLDERYLEGLQNYSVNLYFPICNVHFPKVTVIAHILCDVS